MLEKKTIRVWFSHTWIQNVERLHQVLNVDPSIRFVWDDMAPQYLFAGEQIYEDKHRMKKFVQLCHTPAIRIFFCMEAISPDFNIFDYAITNDFDLHYADRAVRVRYLPAGNLFRGFDDVPDMAAARELLQEKTQFCNFIYSNGAAHPMRDQLFHRISEYRLVHSLGRHLRNFELPVSEDLRSRNLQWMEGSVIMKSAYKFSIACENATFSGYTSEKLLTSFQAKTIPIYWGNPEVAHEYNPKAFINCHNYRSLDEVVAAVKRIDQDDELWCAMISQPPCTSEQIRSRESNAANLRSFLNHIFSQDIDAAVRRPMGYYPMKYARQVTMPISEIQAFMELLGKAKRKMISVIRRLCVRGGGRFFTFLYFYQEKRKYISLCFS